MARNAAIEGEDSKASTQPVHLYRLKDTTASILYLANYPTDIALTSPPADWTDASDPQTFTAAAITHGSLERKDGIGQNDFEVQVVLEDAEMLSRYVIFGIIPELEIQVLKVVPGAAAAGSAEYDIDTQVIQRGVLRELEVTDFEMRLRFTPQAFLTQQEVPRWRFTRVCNHELYGPYCGLNRTLFQHQGAILAIDIDRRQVTIAGDSGLAANYFRLGYLEHAPTGMKIGIFKSELSGGNTIVTLHQYLPDLTVTDNCTLFAGCDHTIGTCGSKFSNTANFGGFPLVPNKNPTIHGAE